MTMVIFTPGIVMNINIVCVGKIKENFLKDGVKEYKKRLTRYCNLNIIEVPDERIPENPSDAQKDEVKHNEGIRIKSKIKNSNFIVATDIHGLELSSEDLAEKINDLAISGISEITILIGGSLGLCNDILRSADLRLSFSKMTFPHQLFRLMLLEQIYRAFKIIHAETYHK